MPPLPKKQMSKAKQRSRAAHYKFRFMATTECPHCHEPKLPHHICPHCG
ncbi:MAG: 50S ribosomal protein L32, partial [Chloroflexi bacterium]|nr:50S ribosomal protein L32 [Chloroflexota bacterium]